MGIDTFTEADQQRVVEFLNFLSAKATFNNLSLKETIQFYGLLSFFQKDLLKKIEANILEVKAVRELKPEKKTKGKSK